MLRKTLVGLTFLIASILIFGCARIVPVRNLYNEPVPSNLTRHQVGVAIINATNERRCWRAVKVKPGLIRATVFVRDHRASVTIPYTNKSYSIIYQNSHNLNAGNGRIHRNFNKWVTLLNRDIHYHLYN